MQIERDLAQTESLRQDGNLALRMTEQYGRFVEAGNDPVSDGAENLTHDFHRNPRFPGSQDKHQRACTDPLRKLRIEYSTAHDGAAAVWERTQGLGLDGQLLCSGFQERLCEN